MPIIVHLLEGEIEFRAGEEAYRLRAGDIITLPGGVPHSLLAFQNSTVRLTLSKQDRTERVEEVVENS